ncbi:hypothetical protein [Hungatella hathewayi]|uniref:hypothetical protein n=1 Tax=Hungatella hathewayi TaxID=154046 RepID=UPI00033FE556|nr:hypothetical protein [Hungatella hathewayi]CCZ62360.1 putative uncharacterized protein [Hungatella hathewayi CAG:224]
MKLISHTEITEPIHYALSRTEKYGLILELVRNETMEAQAYRRTVGETIQIEAADDAGFMYGIFDVADMLRKNETIREAFVTPYLKNRGIKFNIPLDARCPSYSDASTSASKNIMNVWDREFWHEFLDRMAENKYNVLSLWSLSPFPAMVRIPEFPRACIDDVKISTRSFKARLSGKNIFDEDHAANLVTVRKMTIDEKISFWQEIMQYAANRCIRIFVFCWNLFVYGTEGSGYGIEEDQNNPITRKYYYAAVQAMMDTYPLLAGIGVTTGENMNYNGRDTADAESFSSTDIGFVKETYGAAIDDYVKKHPERDFTFIHRMLMARYDHIMEAYENFSGNFEISFKYSQAHMYSSTRPNFIREFLEEKAPDVKVWLTVRNDDYYMYRWGSPDFAREYLANMPVSCLAGYYMGADGYTWGRDYMSRNDDSHPLFIDKMWYMFKIWGQLSYNSELDNQYFKDEIKTRLELDDETTEMLFDAWNEVSNIIPEFNCTHWHDFDFQWYPECCCMYRVDLDKITFANINEFISCEAIPFGEYASVREYAESVVKGMKMEKISPEVQIAAILAHVKRVTELLEQLKGRSADPEYAKIIYDIEALNTLGYYLARKEEAAMALSVYRLNQDKKYQGEAITKLKEALPYWKKYSSMSVRANIPQILTRYCGKVDIQEFDEQAEMDILLAAEE